MNNNIELSVNISFQHVATKTLLIVLLPSLADKALKIPVFIIKKTTPTINRFIL